MDQSLVNLENEYDKASMLHQEVGFRLIERLDMFKLNPRWILDLGSGTGFFHLELMQKYPYSKIIALDIAKGMLEFAKGHYNFAQFSSAPHYICADAEQLPCQDSSMDLIISNCAFYCASSAPQLIKECKRVLKPKGLLLFSSFGPDTLKELRYSAAKVIPGFQDANTLIDMHHLGDMLVHAGFANTVMESEIISLLYENLDELLGDLENSGDAYLFKAPSLGLISKSFSNDLAKEYEAFRLGSGSLPASYEIIYGQALGASLETIFPADNVSTHLIKDSEQKKIPILYRE